jgi:hypothetical protein
LIGFFWVATGSLLVVEGWAVAVGFLVKSRTTGVTFVGLILGNLGRTGFLILGEMEMVGRILLMDETGWIAVFSSVGKVGSSIIRPKPGELSSL